MTNEEFLAMADAGRPEDARQCGSGLTIESDEEGDQEYTCTLAVGHSGPHKIMFGQVDGPIDQTIISITWRRYVRGQPR